MARLALGLLVASLLLAPVAAEETEEEAYRTRIAAALPETHVELRFWAAYRLSDVGVLSLEGPYDAWERAALRARVAEAPDDLGAHVALARLVASEEGEEEAASTFAAAAARAETRLRDVPDDLVALRVLAEARLAASAWNEALELRRRAASLAAAEPMDRFLHGFRLVLEIAYALGLVTDEERRQPWAFIEIAPELPLAPDVRQRLEPLVDELGRAIAQESSRRVDPPRAEWKLWWSLIEALHNRVAVHVMDEAGRAALRAHWSSAVDEWIDEVTDSSPDSPTERYGLWLRSYFVLMAMPVETLDAELARLEASDVARVERLLRALEAHPVQGSDGSMFAGVAALARLLGAGESARAFLERALEDHPERRLLWAGRCGLLPDDAPPDVRLTCAEAWLSVDDSALAHAARARALAAGGHYGEALVAGREALHRAPRQPDLYLIVAELELRTASDEGWISRCFECLERACRLFRECGPDLEEIARLTQYRSALMAIRGYDAYATAPLRYLATRVEDPEPTKRLLAAIQKGADAGPPVMLRVDGVDHGLDELYAEAGIPALLTPNEGLDARIRGFQIGRARVAVLVQRAEAAGIVVEDWVVDRLMLADAGIPSEEDFDRGRMRVRASLQEMGVDESRRRTQVREEVLCRFWLNSQLANSAYFGDTHPPLTVRPAAAQRVFDSYPGAFDEPRAYKWVMWTLPREAGLARAGEMLLHIASEGIPEDRAELGRAFGVEGAFCYESDEFVDASTMLKASEPEIGAWCVAPERKAGDAYLYEGEDGAATVIAVTAIRPARAVPFPEARSRIEEALVRDERKRVELEALLDALEDGAFIEPARDRDTLRDAVAEELDALYERAPWLTPTATAWHGDLPPTVFRSLEEGLAEGKACSCLVLVHVDPSPGDADRGMSNATFEALARKYVVVAISGERGTPDLERLLEEHLLPTGVPLAIAFGPDGELLSWKLPLDEEGALAAMARLSAIAK